MLRLPRLRYLRPASPREAAAMAAELGPRSALVAGGTDLLPKLKRRQMDPDTLVGLSHLDLLRTVRGDAAGGFELGALVTLREAATEPALGAALPGYAEAANLVSSPPLRNVGTIGGNLCVDTRCNYYDMTYEWRRSIGFCMKKDGDICLVAPSSPRCWAVSSSDTAPLAIALGATVVLAGPDGERELPVAALYRDDGIDYLAKRPYEVVTALRLPPAAGTHTAYVKLRRRGSIDFPIAGAGVALRLSGGTVESARIVLSGVGSHPVEATAADAFLAGRELTPEVVTAAAELAAKPAKPLDNADLAHFWRKRMVRVVVEQAIAKAAARGGCVREST
ncbi:MAG TPA: FAD binding domain-containing protein [Candidatus Dormibacteraeota bacterium]